MPIGLNELAYKIIIINYFYMLYVHAYIQSSVLVLHQTPASITTVAINVL